MARGAEAKANVEKKIMEAFGQNFIGTYDKKLYVNARENGELIQVAISLTCPKNPIQFAGTVQTGDFDFENGTPSEVVVKPVQEQVEITPEEIQNMENLMARLGL